MLQELVEFEAAGVIGAERTEDRLTESNGTEAARGESCRAHPPLADVVAIRGVEFRLETGS